MPRSLVAREAILNALHEKLEPVKYVNAMWEGGAAKSRNVPEQQLSSHKKKVS